MYETYYEMGKTPFTRDIPCDKLFVSANQKEVLMRLQYVAKRQLFCVISGPCGTGKSTLIRKFSESLNASEYKLLYISDSKLTARNLYKKLLGKLGYEAKYYVGDAKVQLMNEIESMKAVEHKHVVLLIDEGHLLSREMFEEVRFLMNTHMDSKSPMALIIVGQQELWSKLQLQNYTAIRQRIDIHGKLTCFDKSEVKEYIDHQLKYAGCSSDIFTEKAIDEIYQYSKGSARLVNKVCTSSLIYGCQNKNRLIDDHIIKMIIECELE